MKLIVQIVSVIHSVMALLFAAAALVLVALAVNVGIHALSLDFGRRAAQEVIEAVGLLAAGVVALQIAQTILEEEILRAEHISAPTRVRRFLSRFMLVITIALALEALVATFKAIHEDLSKLPYAAWIVGSTALLVAAWGLFVRFNRAAEELEPESLREVKREDAELRPEHHD